MRYPRVAQDPYLEWAQLTAGAYLRSGPDGPWRITLAPDAVRAITVLDRAAWGLREPAGRNLPAQGWLLPRSDWVSQEAYLPDLLLTEPGMRRFGSPPVMTGGQTSAARLAPLEPGRRVFGLIDGRLGFLNQRFFLHGAPRIKRIWEQGVEVGASGEFWQTPGRFGYGRQLDMAGIDDAVRRCWLGVASLTPVQRQAAEREAYRALDVALPAEADWTHANHVLDLALRHFDNHPDTQAQDAESMDVVAVQLPDAALIDSSGRWAAAYVLDAVDYILAQAPDAAGWVINLSLGAFSGPHDGSSLLERALDQRIEQMGGRLQIVVAAGNAGYVKDDGSGQPVWCRRRVLIQPNRSVKLRWQLDIGDMTETLLEVWSARGSQLQVRVKHRDTGIDSGWVLPAHSGLVRRGDKVVATVMNVASQPTARGAGDLAMVALAHTRSAAGEPVAPTGEWTLHLRNSGSQPVAADAWIERRDVAGELSGYRPQHGFAPNRQERAIVRAELEAAADAPGHAPRRPAPYRWEAEGNLCSMANGLKTVVVGALDADGSIARYSSVGPSGNGRDVDQWEPGDNVATGLLSHTSKSLRGTSMAAACVSGRLLAEMGLSAHEAQSAGG